ncbi:Retrovirus-related Pol polyprotein from transposon opus [Dictyocoela muelleri]|nr:Retrovirus-related Pol polyprotein from transposon opus [Dictyocoela muelleri]
MVDTGSVENYIPDSMVSRHNISVGQLKERKTVELANGSSVSIYEHCNLQFEIMGNTNIKYKSEFLVLPNPTETLILGMRFLTENDAVINLKEGTLTLDGFEYEICQSSLTNNQYDNAIITKSKICSVKDDIKNLIKTAIKTNPALGNITVVEHKIQLSSEPENSFKEYPVPVGIMNEVREHLNILIEKGIIEERNCQFSSPAFIIKKKNGKIRLVVDYRRINAVTIKTHQITPNIQTILASLKGSAFFSVIDLNQGYYQIKISEEDREKTGFMIMNKKYVFNRMPFGLCNAPATFQKAMNIIFAEMSNVITYIDDILIFTESESKHYRILEKVFSLLRKHQISINFEKSVFAQEEVEFLGHRINKCGITPVLTKIESYEDVKIKTKKQLQKILGFMNWFRPFIPNLSILSAPLYDKLRGDGNRIQLD